MKKYILIMKNNIKIELSYKFNFISKNIFKFIQLFLSILIWNSIYSSSNLKMIGNYSLTDMTMYLFITNYMYLLFDFNYIFRLYSQIRKGTLAIILLRPIKLEEENLFYYLGNKAILLIFVLIILFFSVILKFYTFRYMLIILLFLCLNILLFFYTVSIISILSFYLEQIWPLRSILNGIYALFAGIYFPLDLLPDKIYNILKYNPFSLISFIFSNILENKIDSINLIKILIITIIMTFSFRIIYLKFLHLGLKRYEGMRL